MSCATRGLAGVPVLVEADVANGLATFSKGCYTMFVTAFSTAG